MVEVAQHLIDALIIWDLFVHQQLLYASNYFINKKVYNENQTNF